MTGRLETLGEAELEQMLFDATSPGVPGRSAMARVTAIRTILRRRTERQTERAEADARRALELVNATRGPGRQLTELHSVDVATVLANPGWAALVVCDEELRRAAEAFRRRVRAKSRRSTQNEPRSKESNGENQGRRRTQRR